MFVVTNLHKTIWYMTPDMLLQAMAYLAAAMSVRLFLPGASWRHSVALGVSLGLGYLAKAAMFPAALVLLTLLFLRPPKPDPGRRQVLVALLGFALVCAPLVLLLSLQKGRFTFGDTGRLNYAWWIGGVTPYTGWAGENGTGVPAHLPRQVSAKPLILEFRTPVSGTITLVVRPILLA